MAEKKCQITAVDGKSWYFDDSLKTEEYLDKLINTTTLTTKKVTHADIESIGSSVHRLNTRNSQRRQDEAVKAAVTESTLKCKAEFEQTLKGEKRKWKRRHEEALQSVKEDYEQQAAETMRNRDLLEKEKLFVLERRMLQEKEDELSKLQEEMDSKCELAVETALCRQYKRLRERAGAVFESTLERAVQARSSELEQERVRAVREEGERCRMRFEQKIEAERRLHQHEIMKLREKLATVSADKLRPQVANLQAAGVVNAAYSLRVEEDEGRVKCNSHALHNTRVTSQQTNQTFLAHSHAALQTDSGKP